MGQLPGYPDVRSNLPQPTHVPLHALYAKEGHSQQRLKSRRQG